MTVRPAFNAGAFYEASEQGCRKQALALLERELPEAELPDTLRGGLVPHAGWSFSGPLAALTFKALTRERCPEAFVLLGADHSRAAAGGEIFPEGAWQTPLGPVEVDADLAARFAEAGQGLRLNADAHRTREHSLEVQLPLLRTACPDARIVPVLVAPTGEAVEIGTAIGQVLRAAPAGEVAVLASADLTHHGGHFGSPHGTGEAGEQWTRANDRRLLELVEAMRAEAIVPEAMRNGNTCGAGAVAAAVAACRELGATRGVELAYDNSYRILRRRAPDYYHDDTTVGYASVVFA
jgi:hypothetical protein